MDSPVISMSVMTRLRKVLFGECHTKEKTTDKMPETKTQRSKNAQNPKSCFEGIVVIGKNEYRLQAKGRSAAGKKGSR